jgi:signal transduction histidine kinase
MEQVRARLSELSSLASEIAVDVHHVSYELHPSRLRTIGLLPALEALCRETAAKHDLDITFTHNQLPQPVSSNISLPLYRIVQEALHNIVRHSRARSANVSFAAEHTQLVLQIADSGVGFDARQTQQAGLGLVSMRERVALLNGEMAVDAAPGRGTRITVRIPS